VPVCSLTIHASSIIHFLFTANLPISNVVFLINDTKVPKQVHPQAWVAIGTVSILAASAYPVFFAKDTREGHDLFSSEKPAAIREAQEALEEEKRQRQMQERNARAQQQQQQQNPK
jgi:hypothetical protein